MAYDCGVSDDTVEMVHELLKEEADMDGLVILPFSYLSEKLGIDVEEIGRAVYHLVSRGAVANLGLQGRNGSSRLQLMDV